MHNRYNAQQNTNHETVNSLKFFAENTCREHVDGLSNSYVSS